MMGMSMARSRSYLLTIVVSVVLRLESQSQVGRRVLAPFFLVLA